MKHVKWLPKKNRSKELKGWSVITFTVFLMLTSLLVGCEKEEKKQYNILVGAAASLKPVMEDLKLVYQKQNPEVIVTFTFASSGALEQQIREGAPIDVFVSASEKQMNALSQDNLIIEDSVQDLLENRIVMIVPIESKLELTGFEEIHKASMIALGDPESVPVGQYAKEILEGLGIWDMVNRKATFGKDVSEVLSWVKSGNVDAGVVYATDAALANEVKVVSVAPQGTYNKAIYPVAAVKGTKKVAAAKDFIEFLASARAMGVFKEYGFLDADE